MASSAPCQKIKGCPGPRLNIAEAKSFTPSKDGTERAGESDFVPIEHPGDPKGDDYKPVAAAPGQAVEARGDVSFKDYDGLSEIRCGKEARDWLQMDAEDP